MKKVLMICMPIVLVAAILGGYLFWNFLPINRINRAFDEKDYKTVVKRYPDLSKREDRKKVEKKMAKVAEKYYEDYFCEKITYEEVVSFYDLVTERILKKDSHTAENRENIEILRQSREDFAEGERLMEKGRYLEAIEYFYKVSDLHIELKEIANRKMTECKDAYCCEMVAKADERIAKEEYAEAREVILVAIAHFHEEVVLIDKMAEINEYIRLQAMKPTAMGEVWVTTYDLGKLIAEELDVTGYDVYFPMRLILEFDDETIRLNADRDSIKPALDALTADEASMEALYSVAEQFGITRKQADFLVKLLYKGSYSDFIMDYFSNQINEALEEFSLQKTYCADLSKIYIGTETANDDNYIVYSEEGNVLTMMEYVGWDSVLSLAEYPLVWEKR